MKISRLFSRYLISYIGVFLIPLLGLGVFVNKYMFEVLLEKELQSKANSLSTQVSILERQKDEVKKLCIQLSSDSDIKSFSYEKDPIKVYQIIRNIGRYSFTNNFIDHVFILFKEDSFFYSANGAQSLSYFHETNMDGSTIPFEDFTTAVYDSRFEQIWTTGEGIVVAYPYPVQSRNPTGIILVSISRDTLGNYLSVENNERICVSNNDGQVIYGDPALLDMTDESDLVIRECDRAGWEYRLSVDQESLHRNIAPIRKFFIITLAVILIIGFVISTVVTFFHYLPIRRMSTYFLEKHDLSENPRDEFEIIKSSFLNVIKEEEDLRQEMKEREVIFKKDIVSRLLNGRIADVSTLEKAGITMDFSSFSIAIIRLTVKQGSELIDDYRMLQWAWNSESLISHVITTYSSSSELVTLIGHPADVLLDEESLDGFLIHWDKEIRRDMSFYLSRQKDDIGKIGEAYLEALTVKTNQRMEETGLFYHYRDLALSNHHMEYPYEIINRLNYAIENKRSDRIEKAGEEFIEILKENKLDLINSRRLYFNIMNTLLTGLQKDKTWDEGDLPVPDLFTLDQLDSIKDMIELIDKSIKRVIEFLDMKEEDRPVYLKELIVYLDENYTDPNLSLQSLSDFFHLTPAYLSASFKKHIYCNISDYIGDLRIKKAKKMLVSSDLPLKKIVVSLGYADTSSFIRKFKSREKITPGEYRMALK